MGVNARELRAGAVALAVIFAVLFGLTELGIRAYTRFAIIYDVEMTRYAREIKYAAANPKVGHLHRPGSEVVLMGVPVKINSDGFRDKDYPKEKGEAHRIVFLGDSLTFGWGVEYDETFEVLLEAKLNERRPTEIINFGTGNYTAEQEVELFFEKGLTYQPDEVVVFFFINDAEVTAKKSSLAFLGDSRAVTFFWSKAKTVASRWSPSRSFSEFYSALYADDHPGYQALIAAYSALIEVCKKEGIELSFVLLPELHELDPYGFDKEHKKITAFLTERGVPALDLAPAFSAYAASPTELWVALDDAHPNAEAHRKIAELVLPFLAPAPDIVNDVR